MPIWRAYEYFFQPTKIILPAPLQQQEQHCKKNNSQKLVQYETILNIQAQRLHDFQQLQSL